MKMKNKGWSIRLTEEEFDLFESLSKKNDCEKSVLFRSWLTATYWTEKGIQTPSLYNVGGTVISVGQGDKSTVGVVSGHIV